MYILTKAFLNKQQVKQVGIGLDLVDSAQICLKYSNQTAAETFVSFLNRAKHGLSSLQQESLLANLYHPAKMSYLRWSADDSKYALFTRQGIILPELGEIGLEADLTGLNFIPKRVELQLLNEVYQLKISLFNTSSISQRNQPVRLGLFFGGHKLVFLSDGRSFAYFNRLNGAKKRQFQRSSQAYFEWVYQQIIHARLEEIVCLEEDSINFQSKYRQETSSFRAQLLHKLEMAGVKILFIKREAISLVKNEDYQNARLLCASKCI